MTRKSGYSVASSVRLRLDKIKTRRISKGEKVTIHFAIPKVRPGLRIGFGGWIVAPDDAEITAIGLEAPFNLSAGAPPVWRKFGSQWVSDQHGLVRVSVTIRASRTFDLALFGLSSGHVSESGVDGARPALLTNMWSFTPESNFFPVTKGKVSVIHPKGGRTGKSVQLATKSCNRCGRFLPVNLEPMERETLSFSNHCIARAPCQHASFGKIQDDERPEKLHLMHYGFQLECRYCKKFFVNAALNPQRTAGQMKEDGARRRAFEVLLEHLNEGSPQFDFKKRTGKDLASEVFQRFGGACFKCGLKFKSERAMHLDHTRPLALLWPLDEHATALCADHNSMKRDRPPSEFYTEVELKRLARICRLPLSQLVNPSPNLVAIRLLNRRLNWFFDDFITSGQLDKVREGKATASLLVKALQKAIDRAPGGAPFDLVAEARRRGIR